MIKRSRCARGNFKNESTLTAVGQWALNALPGPPRLSCKRPQAPRNAVVVPSPANCSVPGCGSTANNLFAGGTTIYFVCLLFLSSEASVTPSFPIHSLTDTHTHTHLAQLWRRFPQQLRPRLICELYFFDQQKTLFILAEERNALA